VTLFDYPRKIEARTDLQDRMNEADFWNEQEAAQKTITQFKILKAQTEGLESILEDFENIKIGYELAREGDDGELLREVDTDLHRMLGRMAKVELQSLLSGKHDHRNCFVSIHSGDGGTEADDWAGILDRMYLHFWEKKGWDIEEISRIRGVEVGINVVTYRISAPLAFGYMNCERGTHRLARVSPFNAQGKRQTSFATVDVTPELDDSTIEINEKDLEINNFVRASGPGGQNVNKVASAVRLVHKPTGIMVVSSTHKAALQNRKQAMRILQAKLELLEDERRQAELDEATGGSVERGWGSQIRSYVLYDNRVKDHRTNHEIGNPKTVLDGDLDGFINAELQRRRSLRA